MNLVVSDIAVVVVVEVLMVVDAPAPELYIPCAHERCPAACKIRVSGSHL